MIVHGCLYSQWVAYVLWLVSSAVINGWMARVGLKAYISYATVLGGREAKRPRVYGRAGSRSRTAARNPHVN